MIWRRIMNQSYKKINTFIKWFSVHFFIIFSFFGFTFQSIFFTYFIFYSFKLIPELFNFFVLSFLKSFTVLFFINIFYSLIIYNFSNYSDERVEVLDDRGIFNLSFDFTEF